MTLNLTKGGLSPATITNTLTNDVVRFMFNPFEYTLSKSNTWQDRPAAGKNLPKVTFQQGGAITLSLTLHFDSQAQGADVRQYTDKLWAMMMIDDSNVNATSGKGEPPPVMFEWGRLHFKAIINQMSQKFTLFSDQGVPMRCEVTVSLRQYLDESDVAPQLPWQTASGAAPRSATVVEGDRMDHIAANSTGSSSNYRSVAENNNINNPQSVPPGTTLRV